MQPGKCYKYFLLLTLATVLLGGIVNADTRATSYDGLYFSINAGESNVHVEGVLGNDDAETVTFPLMMKLDNNVGVEGNVLTINAFIEYDNTEFTLHNAELAISGFDFDCTTCGLDNGVIQLSFTAGTVPTSTFYSSYVEIATIELKAKCQNVTANRTVGFPEFDPSNPHRNAIIVSGANEHIANDPAELIGKSIHINSLTFGIGVGYTGNTYPGAIGTEIIVPVMFYSESYVDGLTFHVSYDADKLNFIEFVEYSGFFPEGIEGEAPEPGDNNFFVTFGTGDAYDVPPGGADRQVMGMKFYCKYDVSFWDGISTDVSFTGGLAVRVGQNGPGYCAEASSGSFYYTGSETIIIPAYSAEFTSATTGRVFQNDAGTVTFGVDIGMKNNFPMGLIGSTSDNNPADSKIRIDFAFEEVMNAQIDNLYHPTTPDPTEPLDDFDFGVHLIEAKSTAWDVEFFSKYTDGLDNFRDIQPDFQPILQFDLDLDGGWTEPVSFDARTFSVPFACDYSGSPARVLDTTGQRSVECGTGYDPGSLEFEYAVGRVYCPSVLATEPSNVTQNYYLYGNFAVHDFEVVVIKDGVHNVVNYTPQPGVSASFNGTNEITFTDNGNWTAADASNGILIGSVTYSRFYSPPVFEIPEPLSPLKDIGPGTTWCYRTTTISYGPTTFIAGDNGRLPWMYNIANPVKTRYSCGPVHTNPDDDIIDPFKQGLPTEFKLTANYPNPFNPATTIAFELPQSSPVKIEIFNILGQKVATLVNDVRDAGRFEVVWNGLDESGKSVSSGIYFCRMTAGDYTGTLKMMMMK